MWAAPLARWPARTWPTFRRYTGSAPQLSRSAARGPSTAFSSPASSPSCSPPLSEPLAPRQPTARGGRLEPPPASLGPTALPHTGGEPLAQVARQPSPRLDDPFAHAKPALPGIRPPGGHHVHAGVRLRARVKVLAQVSAI